MAEVTLVDNAVSFLLDPRAKTAPFQRKLTFLRDKGLSVDQIIEALKKAGEGDFSTERIERVLSGIEVVASGVAGTAGNNAVTVVSPPIAQYPLRAFAIGAVSGAALLLVIIRLLKWMFPFEIITKNALRSMVGEQAALQSATESVKAQLSTMDRLVGRLQSSLVNIDCRLSARPSGQSQTDASAAKPTTTAAAPAAAATSTVPDEYADLLGGNDVDTKFPSLPVATAAPPAPAAAAADADVSPASASDDAAAPAAASTAAGTAAADATAVPDATHGDAASAGDDDAGVDADTAGAGGDAEGKWSKGPRKHRGRK